MEEEIKKSLKESLSSAFDKWANQYYQKHIDNEGRIPKKIIEEIRQEDLFLSKRVFILGFKRYVTQQVLLNPVLTKQKSVVLRAILKSIIYEYGITVKELEKDAWSARARTRNESPRGKVDSSVRGRQIISRTGQSEDCSPITRSSSPSRVGRKSLAGQR